MRLHNPSTYLILASIAIFAFGAVFLVSASEIVKGVIAVPGASALIAAVFQLARDEARFEKDRELQRLHQTFTVGISSHMSKIVFDKHVEFCEKYMKEVDSTITTLFKEGPTEQALEHAGNLYRLRNEYAAWVTPEISEKLEPFEQTIRNIGADTGFVRSTTGSSEYAEQRSSAIDRMYKSVSEVLNIDSEPSKSETAKAEAVKEHIREILGTNQLTKLRQQILQDALS